MKRILPLILLAFGLVPTYALSGPGDSNHDAAEALLVKNGIAFEDGFRITKFIDYKTGGGIVNGLQLHQGLPVFDAEISFHFGPDGNAVKMPDGRVFSLGNLIDLSNVDIDMEKLMPRDAAWHFVVQEVARLDALDGKQESDSSAAAVYKCGSGSTQAEAELGIVQERAVWRFKCAYRPLPIVYVDAMDGSFLNATATVPGIPGMPGVPPVQLPTE